MPCLTKVEVAVPAAEHLRALGDFPLAPVASAWAYGNLLQGRSRAPGRRQRVGTGTGWRVSQCPAGHLVTGWTVWEPFRTIQESHVSSCVSAPSHLPWERETDKLLPYPVTFQSQGPRSGSQTVTLCLCCILGAASVQGAKNSVPLETLGPLNLLQRR